MRPLGNNKQIWTVSSQTAFYRHSDTRGWKLHKQYLEGRSEKSPLLVNKEGKHGTVGRLQQKRMEQQVNPEKEEEERPP